MVFGDENGTLHSSVSTATIAAAGWHYVAAVVDAASDNVYLYIDGVEEASDNDISTAWSTNPDELYNVLRVCSRKIWENSKKTSPRGSKPGPGGRGRASRASPIIT